MPSQRRESWVHFGDLFAKAEARGLDPLRVARLLLERLSGRSEITAAAQGLRQILDHSGQKWGPRETHWRVAPIDAWATLEKVDTDGTSHWADDEEKPSQWTNIDWFAGSLQQTYYDVDDDGWLRSTTQNFAPLRISTATADNILANIDGREIPVRGRPKTPEDAPLIVEGARLCREERLLPKDAAKRVATETMDHKYRAQVRRLARNIEAAART